MYLKAVTFDIDPVLGVNDEFVNGSPSSSPARFSAVRAPSRSPSPRTKRLRRAQEERDLERSRDRDRGRSHDRDKGRDRGRVKTRDREDDDRTVTREKDRGRDRIRGNSWEQERPRDRRGRDRQRDSSPGDGDAGKDRDRDNETTPKQDDALLKMKEIEAALEKEAKEKEKPSFEYSGKLAAETNKVKGVTLQFTEPPEARKPSTRWRLYVFKDGEPLNDPLYIHRQTCYLFGRERRVADIPTDHPSCSKQHAVIQYRLTEKEEASGATSNKVSDAHLLTIFHCHDRPYLMDLGSTNGTFLNAERLESQRYYEMFEKDTIKFGNSSREYVLLHEHSAG
ncbi:hypothetical protein AXG93_1062s1020 [Marchantia polymorpha subsp. ruderalis]|uniref:FHA domain-containing protein n=1 Tax=Marchantia polymorpha subsp. ruderalis TaxID=1480154 RepID=A0A176W4M6_MARPO|nr:hypothetical protein AXG93_1062s1020 [Marchantia polymorpha subsp. ruderalis]